MAGFRKAKAEQAALKIGLYGLPGSGKTFTALLIAEGLAKLANKRVAYVDTERGTDFYALRVAERKAHPEPFDFDVLHTKSVTEADQAIRSLDPKDYAVVVVDSITHIWEACKAAYSGKTNKAGQIPMHAWGTIKKPYKRLIDYMLSSPLHFMICGRQGNEFAEDENTGEMKKVGNKMKAEGETAYEPHIMINMEGVRDANGVFVNVAFVEKDRTGILSGQNLTSPSFNTIAKPLMKLLGNTQAAIVDEDTTAKKDAEALDAAEHQASVASAETLKTWKRKFQVADSLVELDKAQKSVDASVKAKLNPQDLAELRNSYLQEHDRLSGVTTVPSKTE